MRYALNTVPLNGWATLYGAGTADIVVGATGYSSRQKTGTGVAALTDIDASGALKKAVGSSGTAAIALDAAGALKQAVTGTSLPADLALGARHGTPSPKLVPATFSSAHPSRIIVVPA